MTIIINNDVAVPERKLLIVQVSIARLIERGFLSIPLQDMDWGRIVTHYFHQFENPTVVQVEYLFDDRIFEITCYHDQLPTLDNEQGIPTYHIMDTIHMQKNLEAIHKLYENILIDMDEVLPDVVIE